MDGTPRVCPGAYLLTREASPQFCEPIVVRVIRQLDRPTYDGWAWVEVYQLDRHGDATVRRSLFLMPAGMRPVTVTPVPYAQRRCRPRSTVVGGGG
ncbi:hypothetical protein SAMN05443287_103642 [Micromonospora phaseoli]|uniref:Uncharacterized protein n=1 Tax=Micromonospora phaseoli TaxID=1144548 RepID=A0A1H6XKE9_9ACTN|nr:hypothetical protein [Micromonospora phaseoli]PZW02266.1 hypothetical protein CLV64_102640 [Micromonospora phaseoli]GIJ75730.1 hypothetical protein Xph01_01620 [Micromonospora phaseoli]SEJ28626.1 hypothetical protein SAMN05443287_103642 [Micromonospora phaseoli]